MNLPNKLTVGRVIAVPVFIVAYVMELYFFALVIFILASLTDLLDGQIARKKNLVTNFGKIMDPLADKILVYSALCLFVENAVISSWMLIVILFREFTVSGVRTIAASDGRVIAAGMSGKIKTVFQMIAVPLLILAQALPNYSWIFKAGYAMFFLSLIMTVYSGFVYVKNAQEYFRS